MKILLNGEAFATDAKTLDELCARLGFAEAKIATAVNGSFVAAASRGATPLDRCRRDRDRGAEAGRLMLTLYGKDFTSRLLLGTAQYPVAREPEAGRRRLRRGDRHRLAQARIGPRRAPARASGR